MPKMESGTTLVNMNNLITRREEKAARLNYNLQHVKDKYAISSGKDSDLSSIVAKNLIEKDENLNEKFQELNKYAIIEQYKQGKVTYDEVDNFIEKLDTTYSTITKTVINILTGVSAMAAGIGVRAVQGGNKTPVVMAVSILAGMAAKVGLSMLERSRNNIEGDAFDIKQIAKDAACGAINGAFSGISANVGRHVTGAYVGRKFGYETAKQGVMIGALKSYKKHKMEKSNKIAY